MDSSWQSGLQIGVAVLALCSALVVSSVLGALNPPRRWMWNWVAWSAGGLVAILPLVAFGNMPPVGGLLMGAVGGTVVSGLIELRWRWRKWFYQQWPERARREEQFRAFRPKAFDD